MGRDFQEEVAERARADAADARAAAAAGAPPASPAPGQPAAPAWGAGAGQGMYPSPAVASAARAGAATNGARQFGANGARAPVFAATPDLQARRRLASAAPLHVQHCKIVCPLWLGTG